MKSEKLCYNDICAGTVDFQANSNDGTVIADFKTCATINQEYVRWQLSLYSRLLGKKFDHYYIIHLTQEKGTVIEVFPIDDKEVDDLLNCEINGTIYKSKELVVSGDMIEQTENVLTLTLKLKEAEKRYKEITEEWTKLMQKQGIKSFENDDMKVTFVDETMRESIDTKTFQKDYPDIAEQYKKKVKVAPSVRIKSKKGEKKIGQLD